jgi:hypothetical protein
LTQTKNWPSTIHCCHQLETLRVACRYQSSIIKSYTKVLAWSSRPVLESAGQALRLPFICLWPDSEAVAEGLGRLINPTRPCPACSRLSWKMVGKDDWHMKYHEMKWYDMIWHQMIWHNMIWHKMTWNYVKWREMTLNDMIWHDMTNNKISTLWQPNASTAWQPLVFYLYPDFFVVGWLNDPTHAKLSNYTILT